MSLAKDIQYRYATLNIAEKIILANVAVFIFERLITFFFALDPNLLVSWFELPKNLSAFFVKPWTIVTYAFFHAGFLHLFFNMLLLYFSGRIFLNIFSKKRFITVYLLGAVLGGIVFLISYNIFPVFAGSNPALVGASAAVMAILIFVCTYMPYQDVRMIFFNVKLWQVGLVFVLIDLIQIPMSNAGGHLAHLGGALLGFLYARSIYNQKSVFTKVENAGKLVDVFTSYKKPTLKTVHKSENAQKPTYRSSYQKSEYQQKIDDILDKISKSGYDSLTKEEKDFLFKAGKE